MTPRVSYAVALSVLLWGFTAQSEGQPAFRLDLSIASGASPGCVSEVAAGACGGPVTPGAPPTPACATTPNSPSPIIIDVRATNVSSQPSFNTGIGLSMSPDQTRTFTVVQPPDIPCREEAKGITCQNTDLSRPLAPGASLDMRISYAPPLTSNLHGYLVSGLVVQAGGFTQDLRSMSMAASCLTFATPTCTPLLSVPAAIQSGASYVVSWTETADAPSYELQEATNADFSDATTLTLNGPGRTFQHAVENTTTYFYRVRPTACPSDAPRFSNIGQIVVVAPQAPDSTSFDLIAAFGVATTVRQDVAVNGFPPNGTFVATSNKPYITVTPAAGTVPASGTVNLRVEANTADLSVGTNTGSLVVAATPPAATMRRISAGGPASTTIPINVSLVTPVSPFTRLLPPENSLIIPVVAHVSGANAPFRSDVRLANLFPGSADFNLIFTPTRTAGNSTTTKATIVTAAPGQTTALNDVVKTFFGFGATNSLSDIGFGSLEIRPLRSLSNLHFATSRTYAQIPAGTLGQFVPAIPFSAFLESEQGRTPSISLQQVAQSQHFRTNLGLIEGSASPASGRIRVFSDAGQMLASVPYELLPGEHRQLNSFISAEAGVADLEDGRIDITLESPTGAIAAYASVLDAITTDPLAVTGVDVSKIKATRYIVPGIADLNNGAANFHSDLRVYNGGTSSVVATLTYFAQNGAQGVDLAPIAIAAGEVRVFDNILPAFFDTRNSGGSILITTPSDSSLVATARTFTNAATGGTYGQFIPGVSPADGIKMGDRPLQILQLEQSPQFRSNLGMVELTGNPVRVRITLVLPDSKVSQSIEIDLQPNEFHQLNGVIAAMNPGADVYNGRMSVEVMSGAGRITAYASVIDNRTQDPTYVPAQ